MRKFLGLVLIAAMAACTTNTTPQTMNNTGDSQFKNTHQSYVVEFLRRNPTVNTYLGGSGFDPSLRDVDGTLRDHSAAALEAEDRMSKLGRGASAAIFAAAVVVSGVGVYLVRRGGRTPRPKS